MSEACGVSYDVLAWTMEWYVREETLREANTVILVHHYQLELAKVFGGGTMSSSDGQRFPVRGKTLTGRIMVTRRSGAVDLHPRLGSSLHHCVVRAAGRSCIAPQAKLWRHRLRPLAGRMRMR
ncbi:Tn3 family transposase [Nonomuraea sp. NPDC050680]|uniref:Tn3 family transposase n=1 Tax=Nonomuraea sp. NPDC050680 TaxID=3154630 RepID=UPI0033EEB6F5